VQRLSKSAEGKDNSETVKDVTSVICRSNFMFEPFRLKDHINSSVHACLSEKWLKAASEYQKYFNYTNTFM
jgi:hypothetical protein